MEKKKIKASKRGLTFSLDESDVEIGARYRYVVDKNKNEILIILDENGPLKVSKKKSGRKLKPLFDLRSMEVKQAIGCADYLEVEIQDGKIVVSTYQKFQSRVCSLKGKVCSISDVLGIKTNEIILPIQMAVGAEYDSDVLKGFVSGFLSLSGGDCSESIKTVAKDITKVYDVVSLFSGAGLFDKAWTDGGRFRFVYANDFCKDVIATYQYNIGDHIVCKDIRDVEPNELPFADVFSTSPCCQAFSNANRRDIESESGATKRLLVDEVVRLAKEKKPKVVVIENVPQFLTKEDGLYIGRVIDGLSDYEISAQVIKDHEVGGYSTRARCILIASRIGKIELPKVKCVTYKTVRDALSKVDATWYNYEDVTIPSDKTKEKISYVPQGGNWKDIPAEIGGYGPNTQSNIMRRLSWDKPSITLSNFRKSNILHPEENRILTVAEAASIMGLDHNFRFISKSLSAMQQMVANGVTQAIGKFVKNAVLKRLDEYELGLQIT